MAASVAFSPWTNRSLSATQAGGPATRILPTGKVDVVTGISPHGQGHAAAWSQIVAWALAPVEWNSSCRHPAAAPFVLRLLSRWGVCVFVVSVLLLVAAVVLFVVGSARPEAGWRPWAALSGVAGLLAGLYSCVHVVSAYEVGVPVTFGKIGTPLGSGVHFTSPFTDITSFSTRPVDLNLYDKEVVEVRSSQGGVLYVDVTIKWAVVPAKAVTLYRLAGSTDAVQARMVLPDSREIIRNVFARHTSEEGYASAREQIGAQIESQIKSRLAPRGIDVTAVNLRNVRPSEKLQEQIDKKIQQEQATERAVEAARTAKAEAERKRIQAEGTARANKIIERSLTDKVLYNQCLDAYREAAKANPVYAVPCGTGSDGTPVIVDNGKD